MADDWDLQAVVRGCTTNSAASCSSSNSSTATTSTFICTTPTTTGGGLTSSMVPRQGGNFLHFQDPYGRHGGAEGLNDLYKPFFRKSSPPLSPQSFPISPLSVLGGLQDLPPQFSQQMHHQHHLLKPKQNLSTGPKQTLSIGGISRGKALIATSHTQNSRAKRRKNQMKKVIEIPAEALSSDMWSWRKYGQKPIKGSPYPRGYYRCSTSKGCFARKQVERNRSDPGMFIVTYTADHNHPMPTHRNSLAGSSRQKPATSGDDNKPSISPPGSPSISVSPEQGEKLELESCKDEIIEDEDDIINAPDTNQDDDFFEGLEELAGTSVGILNNFSQNIQLPWLTNNATTTAAGGV